MLNAFLEGRQALALSLLAGCILPVYTAPSPSWNGRRSSHGRSASGHNYDPFAVLDPQDWVNPDNVSQLLQSLQEPRTDCNLKMTWNDYVAVPSTNWNDPSREGSVRNFNIALVVVDYPDEDFIISQSPHSTVFSNPQDLASGIARGDVPSFYHDFLNKPQELNHYHTIHEYWMEDSGGRYGVDLTAFGPYRMPLKSYQYGIDDGEDEFNTGACPDGERCSIDIRTDALGTWRTVVGNSTANSYELVFILSAGQDESSTWQEFGEIMFQTRQDVPDSFGPPVDSLSNWAQTRYVNWTSWASAATIWPNAGDGSSTQGESSGMATYAHELSHLLGIGDNYNNPYDDPAIRSFTGPWSMMSRGSFNGPSGPHTRWEIPATHGGSLGSHHTVRDKWDLGLTDNSTIVNTTRKALTESGPIVVKLTARSVVSDLMALRVGMHEDLEPECDMTTDAFCDGGGYENYYMEVIDRMGTDSFTPDSGVMISKTKRNGFAYPFQWMIDANPQDINLVDFYRPDGTPSMVTIGDYRQLADALFHAGTRSGSEFEYVDGPNRLHFYVIDIDRDDSGVLHYTVGARSMDSTGGANTYGVNVSKGYPVGARGWFGSKPVTKNGLMCHFGLTNTGSYSSEDSEDMSTHMMSDIYRLSAEVDGEGWHIALPNKLATAPFGKSTTANVAVGVMEEAVDEATVMLTATSESDPSISSTGECKVSK